MTRATPSELSDQRDRVAAELARPTGPLRLPKPAYGGRSIPNITSTLARRLSARQPDHAIPLAPPLARALDPWRGSMPEGPVVFLLIDGLGWSTLRRWSTSAKRGPGASWDRFAHPITTVFPTTTTTALVSVSTATPPGRHGFIGYRQYLPRFGVVADMLRMSPTGMTTPDLLLGPEWTPTTMAGAPTIFRRGLEVTVVSRDRFRTSGFTRVLYDGAEYVPYATATDFVQCVTRVLERSRPPPVIFAYWDELDTIQHLYGPESRWTNLELDSVAGLVDKLRRAVSPARRKATTLVITGDHGQVATRPSARIRLEREREIMRETIRPVSGDRRGSFFAARSGRRIALGRALRRRLPSGSRVISVYDTVRAGLFGPPPFHPELVDRIGDWVVLVPSPSAITYRLPGAAETPRYLLGGHGGLEPEELVVPLVAGRLADFGLDD